jgi:large subunit ribosomal protein L6
MVGGVRMSRIGIIPVEIPDNVDVKINKENVITVKGKNSTLTKQLHRDMIINIKSDNIYIKRPSESKLHKSLHGLIRTLVNNMVEGVTKGYEKVLEINGVGYRAQKQGKRLVLTVGYSHPVEMEEPEGITVDVPSTDRVIVKGSDKQAVGEFAAKIRRKRPPEVYKGKGIKYENEIIRHKEGKTGGVKTSV